MLDFSKIGIHPHSTPLALLHVSDGKRVVDAVTLFGEKGV